MSLSTKSLVRPALFIKAKNILRYLDKCIIAFPTAIKHEAKYEAMLNYNVD